MFSSKQDNFLDYYRSEIHYLREAGGAFAHQYPKIANRLELSDDISPDPHTEKLIQSFAFLTAKVNQKIDERFPEITSALLSVLYPHLINPIPSMSIAHLQIDPNKSKIAEGYLVPKKMNLFSVSMEGLTCRFQTSYTMKLWPFQVRRAKIISGGDYTFPAHSSLEKERYLSLEIESATFDLSYFDCDELIFYINCEKTMASYLLESLFRKATHQPVCYSYKNNKAFPFPHESFELVGFKRDDSVLPLKETTTHAYALLQEYFHFPQKFLFFKIKNLKKVFSSATEKKLKLLLPIAGVDSPLESYIKPQTFLLGCTPIVNLFKKITEPQRITGRKTHYRLIPDQKRDRSIEIYDIERIIAGVEGSKDKEIFHPYYSLGHLKEIDSNPIYWVSKRVSAASRGLPGTDILLSFVDLKYNPYQPPQKIFYGEALCTNRFLAEEIIAGSELQIQNITPIKRVICLDKPVPQRHSPQEGETLWKLVSQLSTHHLSLTQNKESLTLLKEILKLHAGERYFHNDQEINSLHALKTYPIVRRMGQEAWRGFVRGVRVELTCERKEDHTKQFPFLLGNILRHYFSLTVSINSFVEFIMRQSNNIQESIQWRPLPGEATLL